MNTLKNKWSALSLREKQTVAGGTLIALLLIAYLIIWMPLSNQVTSLREHIKNKSNLLAWMQEADAHIQTLQKNSQPSTVSTKSILSLVQADINEKGLTKNVTALRQADNQSVQMTLKTISFDDLIQWLTQLSSQQNLQVIQLTASPASIAGTVNAEIILKG